MKKGMLTMDRHETQETPTLVARCGKMWQAGWESGDFAAVLSGLSGLSVLHHSEGQPFSSWILGREGP